MAASSISHHFAAVAFLIFFLRTTSAASNSSFSFNHFGKVSNFGSDIALYGDAEVVNGGYAVQLTSSVSSSAGRAVYKKPMKLYEVSNVSAKNLGPSSANKTQGWIDYEAGSNRLEVRLSKFGGPKPVDPLLWYPIDLSKMWGDKEVFVGLSAMSRNSSQTCSVYSWSFEQRHVPHWMHSQPLDPKAVAKNSKAEALEKKKDCTKRAFGAMVFGVACGALASFVGLYLWTVFGNRRPVVPEGYAEKSKEFEYEKMKVVADNKTIEDGKQ